MVFVRVQTVSSLMPDFDKTFVHDFKNLHYLKDENIKTPNSITLSSRNYLIAKAFLPLIRVMQILGSLPIHTQTTDGIIHYEFRPCSVIFAYSWFSILCLAIFTGEFILNRELHIDWPFQMYLRNNDTSNLFQDPTEFDVPSWVIGANQVFRILMPVFALVNVIAVRIRARPIVQFVNGWATVLDKFETLFESCYKIRLIALDRSHMVVFPFLVAAYIIPGIKINATQKRFLLTENWFLNFWLKTTLVVFVASAFVLSTIVNLLSLLTIKIVYRQIRKAITIQHQETNGQLTYHHVKGWTKLITAVRDQVDLFLRFGSLPELNDLLFTFVTVLALSYIAISLYVENMQTTAGSMMPFAMGALAVAFVRTYVKGQLADMIVMEEHRIGLSVVAMRVNLNNQQKTAYDEAYKTRFEMSVLCNMIFTSPVQIRFANIISLNKKLLLLIISQLASYLVVFLQFKRSPR